MIRLPDEVWNLLDQVMRAGSVKVTADNDTSAYHLVEWDLARRELEEEHRISLTEKGMICHRTEARLRESDQGGVDTSILSE